MTERDNKPKNKGPTYDISKTEELVLLTLYRQELYGLQIPKEIERTSEGQFQLRIGSLYPILHKLEKGGLITSRWGDQPRDERGGARRRYYRITAEGKATLEQLQRIRNQFLGWNPA